MRSHAAIVVLTTHWVLEVKGLSANYRFARPHSEFLRHCSLEPSWIRRTVGLHNKSELLHRIKSGVRVNDEARRNGALLVRVIDESVIGRFPPLLPSHRATMPRLNSSKKGQGWYPSMWRARSPQGHLFGRMLVKGHPSDKDDDDDDYGSDGRRRRKRMRHE